MTEWLGTVALAGSAWLGFAGISALSIRLAWRARLRLRERRSAAERVREGRSAAERVREVERFAWAAIVVPTVLLVATVLPGLAALLGGGDHCERHAEHLHVCLVHPAALSATGGALVALLFGGVAIRSWRQLLPERKGWHAWRRLAGLQAAAGGAFEPVPSQQVFSVAAGLWHYPW